MTKLIKTTDLPSTLDALELMEVRGGEHDQNPGTNHFCIFTSAIKVVCPGGGAVVQCPGGGALKV